MFGLGTTELIVIGVILFLIFGAKRIPEIGKGIGGAVREFRNVKKDLSSGKGQEEEGKKDNQSQENPDSVENKLTDKVLEQVPVVKKAMSIKNKVEKVKKIIE